MTPEEYAQFKESLRLTQEKTARVLILTYRHLLV